MSSSSEAKEIATLLLDRALRDEIEHFVHGGRGSEPRRDHARWRQLLQAINRYESELVIEMTSSAAQLNGDATATRGSQRFITAPPKTSRSR